MGEELADKMRLMAKQGKTSGSPSSAPDPAADSSRFAEAEDTQLHLADHFLIAMPSMLDPIFGGTVVYLCEHNAGGALGVIVNKPTDMTMDVLFERIDLELEIRPHAALLPRTPVMFGGPVQVERGFVLHAPAEKYTSSLDVTDQVVLTTSRDVLEAAAAGNGPEHMLVTLGCAGWGAGQLEDEILRNGWLTVRATPEILFHTPIERRFAAAMALLGVDPSMLSDSAGHA